MTLNYFMTKCISTNEDTVEFVSNKCVGVKKDMWVNI